MDTNACPARHFAQRFHNRIFLARDVIGFKSQHQRLILFHEIYQIPVPVQE